jgi:hypothetical protein
LRIYFWHYIFIKSAVVNKFACYAYQYLNPP